MKPSAFQIKLLLIAQFKTKTGNLRFPVLFLTHIFTHNKKFTNYTHLYVFQYFFSANIELY